ncbi:GDSL-type esterase/lipase family protein [Pseudarthrobacter sp. Y6]|uniref:GDSL-type esterase/lipase family protein n=1 Tax=Pseudarthrobacter sp. Y6 TaxID=3418422 RepID=UPI003CF08199
MAILAAATVAALTGLGQVVAPATPIVAGPTAAVTATDSPSKPVQPAPGTDAFAGVSIMLLGDSLAAGEGAGSYFSGTDQPHQRCHRSAAGWFSGTAADVTNAGCSRAIIRNLDSGQQHAEFNARAEPAQFEATSAETPDITLVMLGGNDIRFAEIFNECVLSDADCTSDGAFTSGALRSAGALTDALAGAYRRVADRVDGKTVLAPAYPQLLGEGASGGCGRISPAEAIFARALIAALNDSVRAAAEEAAKTYADIRFVPATEDALAGHGACDPEPYVHTVLPTALIDAAHKQSAAQELLHPNADGYVRLTESLTGWLASNPSIVTTAP